MSEKYAGNYRAALSPRKAGEESQFVSTYWRVALSIDSNARVTGDNFLFIR